MAPIIEQLRRTKYGDGCASRILRKSPTVMYLVTLFGSQEGHQCHGVSLKIGGYYTRDGRVDYNAPETVKPKSEVNLYPSEVESLCDFLHEQLPRVKENKNRFIAVEDDIEAAAFEALRATLARGDTQEWLDLMTKHALLPDDLARAVLSRERQNELAQFRQMLAGDHPEADWQRWFERNDWVLGTDYVARLDERRIDVGNIADYLMRSIDGHVDVVEIKRPSTPFWSNSRDHENLVAHAELTKAITQSVNYIFELEREMNSTKMLERLKGTPIAKPRVLLILGRSADWGPEEFRAQRLMNANHNCVHVLTYDEVLAKAERAAGPTPTAA